MEPQDTAPRGLRGAGLKYTEEDGVPEWAVGKTADEVLEMTQTLYNAVLTGQQPQGQGNAPPQPQQTETPQPQMQTQQPTQNGGVAPPDPDLAYSNPSEYNSKLQAWMQSQMQQQFQNQAAPYAQGLGEIAKAESKRDPRFAEVWKRYGPEIEAEVASLPAQMKTQPKFWNDAAALIAGRHQEDLFKARMAESAPADAGTMETGGGGAQTGTVSAGDKIAELFRNDDPSIERFKRLKWGPDQVRAKAAKMGYTPDQYAEILTKGRNSGHIYSKGTPKDATEMTHVIQAGTV